MTIIGNSLFAVAQGSDTYRDMGRNKGGRQHQVSFTSWMGLCFSTSSMNRKVTHCKAHLPVAAFLSHFGVQRFLIIGCS